MAEQPNILVIWGDDIGITNLSCYSDGLMGYRTPNIDRIAAEGVRFTDYYGEQSCTAGRAAFISGQNPYRTGLTKVGLPGAPIGYPADDPTIVAASAELVRSGTELSAWQAARKVAHTIAPARAAPTPSPPKALPIQAKPNPRQSPSGEV